MRKEVEKARASGVLFGKDVNSLSFYDKQVTKIIQEMRPEVAPETETGYVGIRFNSDGAVLDRFKTALVLSKLDTAKDLGEDEIRHIVRLALLDAASADYYYTFEKDWG